MKDTYLLISFVLCCRHQQPKDGITPKEKAERQVVNTVNGSIPGYAKRVFNNTESVLLTSSNQMKEDSSSDDRSDDSRSTIRRSLTDEAFDRRQDEMKPLLDLVNVKNENSASDQNVAQFCLQLSQSLQQLPSNKWLAAREEIQEILSKYGTFPSQ